MADLTKEQMVEFITREVMKMLGMDEEEPEDKSCCPDALVIGEADKLPPARETAVSVEESGYL